MKTLSFENALAFHHHSHAISFHLSYIKWPVEEVVIYAALQTPILVITCNATTFILNAILK